MAALYSLAMTKVVDSIREGKLLDITMPTQFRQAIFLETCKRGLLINPNCVACFAQPGFFEGFEFITFGEDNVCCDYQVYMEHVLPYSLVNTPTFADSVTRLDLKVCMLYLDEADQRLRMEGIIRQPSNLGDVCRLIQLCPNVRSLRITLHDKCRCDKIHSKWFPKTGVVEQLANALQNGHCRLQHLQLANVPEQRLQHKTASLAFKSLQSLQLLQCRLTTVAWYTLLGWCPQLRALTLQRSRVTSCDMDPLFPRPLQFLEQVLVEGATEPPPELVTAAVLGLPSLQYARVSINETTSLMAQAQLARVEPPVEVAFYSLEAFPLAQLQLAAMTFGDRLVEIRLKGVYGVPPNIGRWFDRLVNVQSLELMDVLDCDECEDNDRLVQSFLADNVRANRLRYLKIFWPISQATVSRIFASCFGLEFLHLSSRVNEQLVVSDVDMVKWAAGGARPSEVILRLPTKLTKQGVQPLLRNCGGKLRASFLSKDGVTLVDRHPSWMFDILTDLNWG